MKDYYKERCADLDKKIKEMKLPKNNSLWDAQFKKSISKVEHSINEIFICLEEMQERLKELESQREQPVDINHNPSDIKENTPYGRQQQ